MFGLFFSGETQRRIRERERQEMEKKKGGEETRELLKVRERARERLIQMRDSW